MSIPLLCLVLVGVAAVSVGVFWLAHRGSGSDTFLTDTTRGSAIVGIVGTSFAVILAFVTLISLQSYDDASTGAEEGSVAVIELIRTAQLLPASDERMPIQNAAT